MWWNKASIVTIVLILGLILSSGLAAASVSVNTSSNYLGGEAGQSQTIEMTYSLTPDNNDISDVRIEVHSTQNSFIDFGSFERTIEPGDADVEITSVGEGVFEIKEVSADQRITLSFEGYPRDIQQEELSVARIDVEYVQQGQSLDESTTITADMSSSPWFQLQGANERIEELEETVDDGGSGGINLFFGFLIGAAIGAIAAYFVSEQL